jgi:hypothetical protein
MNEKDDFGFEPLAVFKAANDCAIGPRPHVDSPTEPEVIELEAPGNEKGPGAASDYSRRRVRLEAGSVSMMETVEDGHFGQQRTRFIHARFISLEMTIERFKR